jgi:hypothetical protein
MRRRVRCDVDVTWTFLVATEGEEEGHRATLRRVRTADVRVRLRTATAWEGGDDRAIAGTRR